MIADNLEKIRRQIAGAAQRAGRSPQAVTLIAVSKTHPPETILRAVEAGQLVLGENRVQEARAKIPLLPGNLRWHLIGHLQSNKIRQALPLFERLHGIDSLELARGVNRIAGELGRRARIFLEVNVAREASKFGFRPGTLREEFEELLRLEHLSIDGLMTLPPFNEDPEASRGHFAALRELRDRLSGEFGAALPELSMGMSGDFPVAIEEGATFVRVGTAIFGERPKAAA